MGEGVQHKFGVALGYFGSVQTNDATDCCHPNCIDSMAFLTAEMGISRLNGIFGLDSAVAAICDAAIATGPWIELHQFRQSTVNTKSWSVIRKGSREFISNVCRRLISFDRSR